MCSLFFLAKRVLEPFGFVSTSQKATTAVCPAANGHSTMFSQQLCTKTPVRPKREMDSVSLPLLFFCRCLGVVLFPVTCFRFWISLRLGVSLRPGMGLRLRLCRRRLRMAASQSSPAWEAGLIGDGRRSERENEGPT